MGHGVTPPYYFNERGRILPKFGGDGTFFPQVWMSCIVNKATPSVLPHIRKIPKC